MGFMNDFGKKVTDMGQKTVQKTKELSDIARINSLITQEENKLNATYHQIGKLYVSMHGNDCEDEFVGMISSVAESEQKIKHYKEQVQEIKGVQRCEKCGAEIPKGVAFCSSCGAPIPIMQQEKNAENYMKCPGCGAIIQKGMRFCTSCGKSLSQLAMPMSVIQDNTENSVVDANEMICLECGTKNADDALFCIECGNELKQHADAVPDDKEINLHASENEPSASVSEGMSGTTSVEKKICPNCGAKIDDDGIFCTECGFKIK